MRIDGRVVNDLTPKDRDIAMVFQSYALYGHSRVRNFIIGSTTSEMTRSVLIPVMLFH